MPGKGNGGGKPGGGNNNGGVFIGSEFDDAITGSSGDDTITGLGGDDYLSGVDGNDIIIGGSGTTEDPAAEPDSDGDGVPDFDGNDRLFGGSGDDSLYGGSGDDELQGGTGVDYLDGGSGFDVAYYTESDYGITVMPYANDPEDYGFKIEFETLTSDQDEWAIRIEGIAGSYYGDTLTGADDRENWFDGYYGDDTITGGSQNDAINGGGDNDTLAGGAGDDLIVGGSGNDLIIEGGGSDIINGGSNAWWEPPDHDVVTYAGAGAGLTLAGQVDDLFDPSTGEPTGQTAYTYRVDLAGDTDLLWNVEEVRGTGFPDTMTGGTDGDSGVDHFVGGDGADVLDGGDDDDLLNGGAGSDFLVGGNGNDTATYARDGAGVTVDLAAYSATDGEGDSDTLDGIENVIGSAYADTLSGDGGANSLIGSDGADKLIGGGGNDVLSGGMGADTLNGDDDDDILDGGAGGDSLDGGDGNDTVTYAGSGSGVQVTINGAASLGDADGDSLNGIENLIGSAYTDALTGDGSANALAGGGGDDLLSGLEDSDTLDGGSGNDSLDGGDGDDVLVGSYGSDVMSGGSGADTFLYYSTSQGGDTIDDFSGDGGDGDIIDLSELHLAGDSKQYIALIGNELWVDLDGGGPVRGSGDDVLIATFSDGAAEFSIATDVLI